MHLIVSFCDIYVSCQLLDFLYNYVVNILYFIFISHCYADIGFVYIYATVLCAFCLVSSFM